MCPINSRSLELRGAKEHSFFIAANQRNMLEEQRVQQIEGSRNHAWQSNDAAPSN